MPFNELQRRDSWPPTLVHIRDTHNPRTDTFEPANLDIDENPFSYFLTSPEDLDDFDDEDLSAGIESPSLPKPVIREVSPSSLQRIPLPIPSDSEEESEEEFGLEMPLTLKDFTKKFTSYTPRSPKPSSGRKSRTEKHHEVTGLGITIPENTPMRGRARVKLTSRGKGRTRSLSARRPQSWRLPSPDMYAIEEENEDEEKVVRAKTPEIVVTTPTEAHIYHLAPPAPKPKPKKRVHWAI